MFTRANFPMVQFSYRVHAYKPMTHCGPAQIEPLTKLSRQSWWAFGGRRTSLSGQKLTTGSMLLHWRSFIAFSKSSK
jgi:hypothetical protein